MNLLIFLLNIFEFFQNFFTFVEIPFSKQAITRKFLSVICNLVTKTSKISNFHSSFKISKNNFKHVEKKDVNRDSHITFLPISRSSFFEEIYCLILASSQRKLRGYIEKFKNLMTR